jgi:hypothetical protein
MARKKKDTQGANAAPETTTTTKEAEDSSEPMVTILKTATAPKLSPRGSGDLTYQIGLMNSTVLLRIHKNDSSGRFSNEWVAAEAIRQSIASLPKGVTSFKGAVALKSAWKGQSSCNSGFGAAILRAEKVFAADPDPKKKGMLMLASPDALDQWEASILALPVPKDAERVLRQPPKAKPFFSRKKDDAAAEVAPVADEVEPVEEVEPVDAEGDADPDDDA